VFFLSLSLSGMGRVEIAAEGGAARGCSKMVSCECKEVKREEFGSSNRGSWA